LWITLSVDSDMMIQNLHVRILVSASRSSSCSNRYIIMNIHGALKGLLFKYVVFVEINYWLSSVRWVKEWVPFLSDGR
jgi:hypothetical protein